MPSDPYRVLGLNPGASAADVKRAYRALAKANHPDSAGERALPQFLAIQAAYEQLSVQQGRGTARGSRSGPAAEPWKAEPSKAREARRGSRPAGAGTGPASERGTGGPTRRRTGPAANAGGGASTGGPRRRAGRKATFGSTSYDGSHDASDPAWQGAAWYGPSSGEYWTVNPREYADPRKHGPEYQARAADRAKRAEQARAQAADPGAGAAAGPAAGTRPNEGRRPDTPPAAKARTEPPPEASSARARTYARERAEAATRARSAAGTREAPGVPRGPGGPGSDAPASPLPLGMDFIPSIDLSVIERSSFRRVLFALLAWPPIGIAAAALIGKSTGCAAFSASCTREGAILPWLAQAVILLVLLAAPFVARVLIGGTAAVLIVAFPAAATLSASGARYDRAYGPASLLAILAIAWVVGVVVMVIRAARKRSAA